MSRQQQQVNPYLRTRVMTASPEQLRLMLYDGAIKFCRQAQDALGRQDWEAMYNALTRSQKILLELSTSLNHEANPELCEKLTALYNYMYRRLVDANLERDAEPVRETLDLLLYQRESWAMFIKEMEKQGRVGRTADAETEASAQAIEEPSAAAAPSSSGQHANPVGRISPEAGEDGPSAGSSLSIQG